MDVKRLLASTGSDEFTSVGAWVAGDIFFEFQVTSLRNPFLALDFDSKFGALAEFELKFFLASHLLALHIRTHW